MHELNDGCRWRFTIPDVDIEEFNGHAPVCTSDIFINFKLVCCDLSEDCSDEVLGQLSYDDIEWKVLTEQSLCIHHVTSDWHEYFPVSGSTSSSSLHSNLFFVLTMSLMPL